jgi:hypothetical protein
MPCRLASLFTGALLGNLEEFICWNFERKEKYIWVPLLDLEAIKI